MNKFCQFQTSYAGKCLMWLGESSSSEFCKKHFGKVEKPRLNKIGKYSGYSKYAEENGLYKRKRIA